jgi:hypothetical protein
MKCPTCGYTSFPYLESCAKCGHEMAEPRAALGLYALRAEPPDLLLAYQAANAEGTGAALPQPPSVPGIDLGHLDEIELELGEAEQTSPAIHEVEQPAGAAPDFVPTLDPTPTGEGELLPAELHVEPVSSQDMVMPQTLDLSELGDITLELETAADLGGPPSESTQTPREAPEFKPVYDLDLDEELEDLPLGSSVDESHADNADNDDEETTEYMLEIEDEIELEVEELEIEEDDEAGEEDDHR